MLFGCISLSVSPEVDKNEFRASAGCTLCTAGFCTRVFPEYFLLENQEHEGLCLKVPLKQKAAVSLDGSQAFNAWIFSVIVLCVVFLLFFFSFLSLILSLEAKLNLLHSYMNVTWIRIPSETRVTSFNFA